jgi:hypothetical protein
MAEKVMDQMREHWQKICAILVWKYGQDRPEGGKHLVLSMEDMVNFPQDMAFLTRGHPDALQLYVITPDQAAQIEKEVVGRGGIGIHE